MDTVAVLSSSAEAALEKSSFFSTLKSGGMRREHLTDAFSHNTVHLGVQKPYITDRVFWDRQRWRVFLPACQPAFV